MTHRRANSISKSRRGDDEPLSMRRDLDLLGPASPQDYFYHQDDLFNVVALTNAAGAIVERITYGDYGFPTINDANGAFAASESTVGNPYLFTGREWDGEFRFYQYRTRSMDPTLARFTTRDTIGVWGDERNHGNGDAYLANSPVKHMDPFGLQAASPFDPATSPVEPREPKFEGPAWYRYFHVPNFSEQTKDALRTAARSACTRAQNALRALSNGSLASCVANALKDSNLTAGFLEGVLRTFLGHFCRGSQSPGQFILRPTSRDNAPQIIEPFFNGFPRQDRDFPFWIPVDDEGNPVPQSPLETTIMHEACHQISNTPDAPDPNLGRYPNTQQGVDLAIDRLLQCAKAK